METWKLLIINPNYLISSYGKVVSLELMIILHQELYQGYYYVRLPDESGRNKNWEVAYLIILSFFSNSKFNYISITHLNDNTCDNRLCNLTYTINDKILTVKPLKIKKLKKTPKVYPIRIYKIVNNCDNMIYIGSTKKKLSRRFEEHKNSYILNNYCSSAKIFEKYGLNNCKIERIASYLVKSFFEQVTWEQYHYDELKDFLVNINRPVCLKKI
jgi:hypothetical protein